MPAACPAACPALPALLDGGSLPFSRKTQISFPPSKNSRHFFKKASPSLYLTHH